MRRFRGRYRPTFLGCRQLATLTSDTSSNQALAPGLPVEARPARRRRLPVPSGTVNRVLTLVHWASPVIGEAFSVVAPPIIRLAFLSSFLSQNCTMMTAGFLALAVLIHPESS